MNVAKKSNGYDVFSIRSNFKEFRGLGQIYSYRVPQTIQMKLILLCVCAERAVLGSDKTVLKFKYEI